MIFFSPLSALSGTSDWLPKMLLEATDRTHRMEIIYPQLLSCSQRFLPLASRGSARVIKSESINGTSQSTINNPVSSGRRPFRNLLRRRYRRKEAQSNIQNERDRISWEGNLRCRIKNFRHPTRLHYATFPSSILAEHISTCKYNYFVFALCVAEALKKNIEFAIDRYFPLFIVEWNTDSVMRNWVCFSRL